MKKRRSLKQIFSDAGSMLLNDIKSAKWAIVVIIAYFVLFRIIFHSICPMVAVTGFPCPACGLTRAGFAALSCDFGRAWEMHPFIYAFIILIILAGIGRYFLKKRKMPFLRLCLIITLAALLVFYVWRMYWYFPGEPPMSYYKGNLLRRLIHLLHL